MEGNFFSANQRERGKRHGAAEVGVYDALEDKLVVFAFLFFYQQYEILFCNLTEVSYTSTSFFRNITVFD